MVIGLCDRWHKTPDEILDMDARGLRMLALLQLAMPAEGSSSPAPPPSLLETIPQVPLGR